MLRTVQKKIILMFLIIGVLIIGFIGYINYIGIQRVQEDITNNPENYNIVINEYKNQTKIISVCGVLTFTLMSIIIRNICN